jgi:hypothetical protein
VNVAPFGVYAAPETLHYVPFNPLLLLRRVVVTVVNDESGFHLALAARAVELLHEKRGQVSVE